MSWTNDMAAMLNQNGSGMTIKLGQMTGANTAKVGKLELTKDDLLFADHLLKQVCTQVKETANAEGSVCTDQSTYISALKSGDTVAMVQISDSKFLILGRMVSA